jgi:hypothetical protein
MPSRSTPYDPQLQFTYDWTRWSQVGGGMAVHTVPPGREIGLIDWQGDRVDWMSG